MINRLFFTITFLFIIVGIKAQHVTNVSFEQVGKQIHIYYDLKGEGSYNVNVYCSKDGGKTWGNALESVTGEIGEDQKLGSSKLIIWDVLKDKKELSGNIEFKIESYKNIDMIYVKGGTFQMGSDNGFDDEKPVHTVTVNDFYIGKHEVTQKQWEDIMGSNPSYFNNLLDDSGVPIKAFNLPVENLSWNDIQEFIKKLNQKTGKSYRLPTEAEWEYAARGGNKSNGYKYSGSNDIDEVAWYTNNSGSKTHFVGQKKANELGIFDMSGNVWEWCSDWYGTYPSASQINPQGSNSGSYRVIRSGSCDNIDFGSRIAFRTSDYNKCPGNSCYFIGFRLALPK